MSESLKSRIRARSTIEDVAKVAGVSIKTVSRVTNNEPNVRDSTRAKVMEAISELDYLPNPSARSLAARHSYLLGLLYDNPSASYLISIQNGVLAATRAAGYDIVLHPCSVTDPNVLPGITRMVRKSKVDGLILTPPLSDMTSLVELLGELGVRFVRVSPADRTDPQHSIVTNDTAVCREMVRHLNGLGHTRIAFIIGHPDHGAVLKRYEGYRLGMEELGLPVREDYVVQGYNSFESGVTCAAQLLDVDEMPTAIFASNDDMAAGVIHVAHAKGLSLPGDLSVAGFDDIPLARQLWPSLTTIHQPMEEMAATASRLLLSEVGNQAIPAPEQHAIASQLVIRDSTAAPRSS